MTLELAQERTMYGKLMRKHWTPQNLFYGFMES